MQRKWLFMALIASMTLPLAGAQVTQELVPYRGDPIPGKEDVTFDGQAFQVPGVGAVPRNDIQTIEFQLSEHAEAVGEEQIAESGLTELAAGLVEEGRAMAQQYPGVGGVILVDDGVYTYNADGSFGYTYHFAGLVLREEMKAWAQINEGFTQGRSRVRLLFARAVAPDGAITTLDPGALEVSSPSEEEAFFNPNRKMVSGVIPGVEIGSIIEYKYAWENYNPEDPRLFFPGFFFQGSEPVVLSRLAISVPEGTTFHFTTRKFGDAQKSEPDVATQDGRKTYTWALEQMPPIIPEPSMPPQRDIVPMVEGSVFKDYEDAFALQRQLQLARMKLTPEIEAKAKEITEGATTVDEKLAAIYHWVQENTRYISIKGSLGSGWSGHTAQETFDNRYGDCTDKAILFSTMTQALGITSYPVILMTNDQGTGITEIPTLDANHCITEVELNDGRRFYLDTTAQDFRYPYFRPDDHGAFAINAIRGDVQAIPVPPPEDNRRDSRMEVALTASGDVEVRTKNEYQGAIEAGVRGFWKTVREDTRGARMSEYVNSISPGAILTDFSMSELEDLNVPLSMTLDYDLPKHAVRARDLMYMQVPTLEEDYPEVSLDTRQHPIQYMTTEERILTVNISLPEGWRVKWTPAPLEITNPYLEYRAAYTDKGETLELKQTFRRLQRIVPPEDYTAYRDALRSIAQFTKQEVFFSEEGAPNA